MQIAKSESNRRSIYRVQPAPNEALQLTVNTDRAGFVPDEVGDVSIKGVSLRFTKGRSPELKAGAQVSLAIESQRLKGRAEVSARVVYAGENPTGRLFRLEFDKPLPLSELSNRDTFQLFNRRVEVRGVTPASAEEFDAHILRNDIENLQRELSVAVRNISTMGVCLSVATAADSFLTKTPEFALSLRIPGTLGADLIAVHSRYRAQDDNGVRYGCEFNWQETANALALVAKLNDYMLDRFDATLKELRH